MASTTFLGITYPDENENPFYNKYKAQMQSLDRILYQAKIQSQLIVGGGGTVSFNSTTNLLTWTSDLVIPIAIYGYKINVKFGPDYSTRQAALAEGSLMYVDIPFVLTGNVDRNIEVASSIDKNNHQLFVIGYRTGSKVYMNGLGVIG